MKGIRKRARFPEKSWKEFAREPSSWRKAGRNLQKSQVPGKEPEGIHKVASFLEESWKEFTKESASGKRNRRNLQKNCLPGKKREGIFKRASFLETQPPLFAIPVMLNECR